MGDIISLEAYRKRRAAKPAPLPSPQKGVKETQRSTITVKPAPADTTERDKDPPAG